MSAKTCSTCKFQKVDGWAEPCNSCDNDRSLWTSDLPELRLRALDLYKAPFKFHRGYIWDANSEIVADDGDLTTTVARVRGWGRIQQLPDAAALQDEVGHMLADALNDYYEKHKP